MIDSNSIFRHLSEEELAQIPIDQDPEHYKRGTIIYEEGAGYQAFFVYRRGSLKFIKQALMEKSKL